MGGRESRFDQIVLARFGALDLATIRVNANVQYSSVRNTGYSRRPVLGGILASVPVAVVLPVQASKLNRFAYFDCFWRAQRFHWGVRSVGTSRPFYVMPDQARQVAFHGASSFLRADSERSGG